MLIDAHNHLQDKLFHGRQDEIIVQMQSVGITGSIANGTCEDDWPRVAELARAYPNYITPSFGLHPWKVSTRSDHWLSVLKEHLLEFPNAGLGECGLDRCITQPHFQEQKEVFLSQLILAQELARPVTVHCLKAWGPLLEILYSLEKSPRFLIHSFGGSLEMAHELTQLGAYFSIYGHFFHERKTPQLKVFKNLPPDRILIETDAPYMIPPAALIDFPFDAINHPANLLRILKSLLNDSEITQEQHFKNTMTFFDL